MDFPRGKGRQKNMQSFPAASPKAAESPFYFQGCFSAGIFLLSVQQSRRGEQLMWCKGNQWGFLGFLSRILPGKVLLSLTCYPCLPGDGHFSTISWCSSALLSLKKCVGTFICRKKCSYKKKKANSKTPLACPVCESLLSWYLAFCLLAQLHHKTFPGETTELLSRSILF